jgi:hypothetical protein
MRNHQRHALAVKNVALSGNNVIELKKQCGRQQTTVLDEETMV